MQDYLCDFRQRLDTRADALSGSVREQHDDKGGEGDEQEARHKQAHLSATST